MKGRHAEEMLRKLGSPASWGRGSWVGHLVRQPSCEQLAKKLGGVVFNTLP